MAMDGMSEAGSHYAVLGVAHEASVEEIRKAHRFLALKWHPDKVADPTDQISVRVATQQFQLVQAAYEVLADVQKRQKYNEQLGISSLQPGQKRSRSVVSANWAHSDAVSLRVPEDVSTIAAAVDRLSAAGGVIEVAAGTYDGLVVVSKPLVKLICKSAEKAVIRGQVVFRECATGAEIKNFRIEVSAGAAGAGAVDLKGVVGDILIQDCDISNDHSAGLVLEGCSGHVQIKGCCIHDCKFDGFGLHLLKGDSSSKGSVTVEESVIQRNGYDGLYLGDPRFVVVLRQSRVCQNKRHGVLVRGSNFSMEGSTVEENGEDSVRTEEFVHKQNLRGTQKVGKAREVVAELPEGWRAFRNSEGLVYYYHMQSGTTRWSLPGSEDTGKPETPAIAIAGREGRRSRWS